MPYYEMRRTVKKTISCRNQSTESTIRRFTLLRILINFILFENCCFVNYYLLPTTTATTTTIFSAHILTIYIR